MSSLIFLYVATPTRWLHVVEVLWNVASMCDPTTVRYWVKTTSGMQLQLPGVAVEEATVVAVEDATLVAVEDATTVLVAVRSGVLVELATTVLVAVRTGVFVDRTGVSVGGTGVAVVVSQNGTPWLDSSPRRRTP
jgi:hypothetical protein